jgi:N-acyl-D-amino-acid deacylase
MRGLGFGILCYLGAALLSAGAARTGRPRASTSDPSAAARRGLALIEHGAANYLTRQECFSCHHQALPLMTWSLAERRGLAIDRAGRQKQIDFTLDYFIPAVAEMRRGIGVQGANDTVGYALAGLAAAGVEPDTTTEAMAEFLLRRQLPDGSWLVSADRPPFEGSSFAVTALALAGLRRYCPSARSGDRTAAERRAAAWLRSAAPKDAEDRVYELRSLALLGDEPARKRAVEALRAAQRPDGGWSQLPRLGSDAYATGSVLLALTEAGGVPSSDPAYRKGIDFLIAAQLPDGSWYVQTRARPLQVFFDNGDPHGKSQFISFAATNLATMAIIQSLPGESRPGDARRAAGYPGGGSGP